MSSILTSQRSTVPPPTEPRATVPHSTLKHFLLKRGTRVMLACIASTILLAAGPSAALPCAASATATHAGLGGTTASLTIDGSTTTAFESSHGNWQYVQIRFDCEVEIKALRRMMSRNGSFTGRRSWQGEQFSYSLDGQSFTHVTPAASTGWEAYVAYHPRAWHSVAYGWSSWLRPNQPVRARYLRFHWDGNDDRLHEIEAATAPGLDVTDVRLTQSGMVTTAIPQLPLVAGKTTLLRATVISSIGGPTVADEAFVDVYREDTGALVATVRGHAIANDNRSLRNA
ncbi:MAG: discoidin domain-containing protein, partial [Acidobacteriota bacterium]